MEYMHEHHETLHGLRERDKFEYVVDVFFDELEEKVVCLN